MSRRIDSRRIIDSKQRNAATWRETMATADTGADQTWSRLVAAPEDERQTEMQARYTEVASLPEDERNRRLRAMAEAEYALPDAELRSFTVSRLRALLSIDPDAARTITTTNDTVMKQMPGGVAMRRVSLIQTLAREFTPDEQHQLRERIPGVFGDQAISAAVAAASATPGAATTSAQPATSTKKKPWWAFWRS
jgi:hypothetical protein